MKAVRTLIINKKIYEIHVSKPGYFKCKECSLYYQAVDCLDKIVPPCENFPEGTYFQKLTVQEK